LKGGRLGGREQSIKKEQRTRSIKRGTESQRMVGGVKKKKRVGDRLNGAF
jgi:hypothetical protein